jgi:HPt (histidine-containing phosphotransfer) domain-containing protein
MDDYLSKPVDAGELAAALARWIPQKAFANARPPSVDPGRLAILRELGPADGRGLLPAAAEAFRRDLPMRLAALRHALEDGDGSDVEQAAHALKGAAANIGATAAAELCQQLERMGTNRDHHGGRDLVNRLEEELALVETALDDALGVTP